MAEEDDLAGLPKKSFRGYAETEELCAITSRETRIDPHTVNLLVMRSFRALPRDLRQAWLTEDETRKDELLMQWFRDSLSARGLEVDVREGDDFDARAKQINKLVSQLQMIHAGVREVAAAAKKSSKGAK